MTSTRTLLRVALIAALLFLALWPMQRGGWLKPMNSAVDSALYDGLRHPVGYPATCHDSKCSFEVFSRSQSGRFDYSSHPLRNGTWNETHFIQESIVPWHAIPLKLGEAVAATGIAVATVLLLLLLGAWRSALVAGATAAVGGYLVGPLKYGGSWAPYPSGHTIGATLMWGLLLCMCAATARRQRVALSARAERTALWVWIGIAFVVGLDLINSGYHPISDVLLGWAYSTALVFVALWLDAIWQDRKFKHESQTGGVEA